MEEELKRIALPQGFGQTRGSEHEVWRLPEGGRVLKATHPGEFGRKFGPARFASFEEYVLHVRLTREIFGLDWRLEGIHGEGKTLRVVTSQPLYVGKPAPALKIGKYLSSFGFNYYATRYGDAWYSEVGNLLRLRRRAKELHPCSRVPCSH